MQQGVATHVESQLPVRPNFTVGTTLTGAQAIVAGLKRHGISRVYGYPGGAIIPVYDAFYEDGGIEHILFRHEQGAIHAAQGWARVMRQTAVVIVTSGPGATNIVTGLGDALLDSTPLVCITGQVARSLLGTDAFQETDVVGCTMSVTKWNIQVTRAADLPAALDKAFYVANTGRPGPTLIDVTRDAQLELFELASAKPFTTRSYVARPRVEASAIQAAAELLNAAERPLIFAGQGLQIADAVPQLHTLLERYAAPTVMTMQGLGNLPFEHPCYFGMAGVYGHIAANRLMNDVDVILALGMRFDDRVTGKIATFAPQAKVVHIDIDASEIDKNVRSYVPVLGDLSDALQLLVPALDVKSFPAWNSRLRALDDIEKATVRIPVTSPAADGPPSMEQVVAEVSRQASPDAAMVADVGQHQMAAARYFNYRKPNRWVSSGGAGTMGFALPAAVGVQFALPGTQVFCIAGDGGFQMTAQELGTAYEHKLPIKVVLLDNARLGMVRQLQDNLLDGHAYGVEMVNPDFCVLAKAYRWSSLALNRAGDCAEAIAWLIATPGPCLLHVSVDPRADTFPLVPASGRLIDIQLHLDEVV